MPRYESIVTIRLTASTLGGQVAECREKLDRWLATLAPPPPGQVQALQMTSFYPLRYEVFVRPQVTSEDRTIL